MLILKEGVVVVKARNKWLTRSFETVFGVTQTLIDYIPLKWARNDLSNATETNSTKISKFCII